MKVNIIDLDDASVKRIIHFIEKYGVDFIEHDTERDIQDYNYFSRFTYIWSQFKMLNILLESDKAIPYSKSKKRYKNTGLVVHEFQKSIINMYLSRAKKFPITNDKETLKDIYENYDYPVSLLFEYLVEKGLKVRSCEYCNKHFLVKRKDAKGCSSHHNGLIRAKRRRLKNDFRK